MNVVTARTQDLEQQLEQRSEFEHAVILKLEDITERFHEAQDKMMDMEADKMNLSKQNEHLRRKLEKFESDALQGKFKENV